MSPLMNGLIVAAFVSVLGAMVKSLSSMHDRLRAIELQLQKLDTQVSPLWARVQAQISSDLHHPHIRYREMDALLEALDSHTISDTDRDRLKILLATRAADMHADISDEERIKASAMVHVMDLVVIERDSTAPLTMETVLVDEASQRRMGDNHAA